MCGKGWRCTHKAVHTQGDLWPLQESSLGGGGGVVGAGTRVEQSELSIKRIEPRRAMCVGRVGGAHTRRCTHKAACGHCRSLVTWGGGGGGGTRIEQRELSVERSEPRCAMCVGRVGGAHTRRCIPPKE